MPVSSFAPELMQLFQRAALEEISVDLGSYKRAARLRFRMNNLRKAMRLEKHPLTTIANSVQLCLGKGSSILIAKPADDQFLPELKKVGISLPDVPQTIVEAHQAASVEDSDTLASETLRKFLGEKKGD